MDSKFEKVKQVWRGNQPITVHVPGLKGGAGDVVRRFTEAIGIKPCPACEKRRQALNQRLRFR
jgi:hypothetical protein